MIENNFGWIRIYGAKPTFFENGRKMGAQWRALSSPYTITIKVMSNLEQLLGEGNSKIHQFLFCNQWQCE